MYSSTALPAPLPHSTFYVLLALARGEAHGYTIGAIAHNDSLRSLSMPDGFIEPTGLQPTGVSGRERLHYQLTPNGKHRLKAELQRLDYALQIGKSAHLVNNDIPLEIQQWLDRVR